MYSNPSCHREASGVHSYECKLNLNRHRAKETADSYRIFLTVRAFLQKPIEEILSAADGDSDAGDGYSGLMRMLTHHEDRGEEANGKYLILASLIYRLLLKCGYAMPEDDVGRCLEAIHRVMQIQARASEWLAN